MNTKGMVYLVGAGPGDAGLLTLRGAEVLRQAEVVVYDAQVNPELLRWAPAAAERICCSDQPGPSAVAPAELSALVISKSREGKCVVRLQAGDPFIFGHGHEEAQSLAGARVPFEIVPGVSGVLAAATCAGIPLAGSLSQGGFTVWTGPNDATWEVTDLRPFAASPGTKVMVLEWEHLCQVADRLLVCGLAPETPLALVYVHPNSPPRCLEATLGTVRTLADQVTEMHTRAVVILGESVHRRQKPAPGDRHPLLGQRVVVTRARDQAGPLTRRLVDLGAEVLQIPTIKTAAPTRKQDLVDVLMSLNAYDWLVFTSPTGVTAFFEYFFKRYQDMRDLGGARIAAIGPGTAAKLREVHVQVDLMPEEALASKIARAFARYQSIENLKICLLRAEVANPDLPRALEALGAIVDDVAVYRTVAETEDDDGAGARLQAEGADWITFTSGSTVQHFHARFDLPKLLARFPQIKLATLGPETSQHVEALGLKVAVEAKDHTIDGLVAALAKACRAA